VKETLVKLYGGDVLTHSQAVEALVELASGNYSDAEIASFLTVYLMRKIEPAELLGFRDAMLEMCVQINLSDYKLVDVCGTGGDEKNTFNISSISAFVLAGAGVKVAKHGNYAVSSPVGSSNVFEHFGYKFGNDVDKLKRELDQANICSLHAPMFHPAMKNVGPARKALKIKTFFNMLGPMSNPARPKCQFVGVFSQPTLELFSSVYKLTDINHIIVYSLDGYDEVSLTSDFMISSNSQAQVISPKSIGFTDVRPGALFGGNNIAEAADIFTTVLEGKGTQSQNDVVIVNAAYAMLTYHPEKSIEECIALSSESLKGGKALAAFKKLFSIQ
jgi:anthranilate phosphoribosyltransferase